MKNYLTLQNWGGIEESWDHNECNLRHYFSKRFTIYFKVRDVTSYAAIHGKRIFSKAILFLRSIYLVNHNYFL